HPFVMAIFASVFGISSFAFRLPSLVGALIIFWVAYHFYLKNLLNKIHWTYFMVWLFVTAFNPMIWVYSHSATNDILPVGLVVLSFYLCFKARNNWYIHLIAGLIFSISCVIKWNSMLLGLGFIYLLFFNDEGRFVWNRTKLYYSVSYTLLPLALLGVYFAYIYTNFGIFILPEKYKTVHSFHLKGVLLNLSNYISFLGVMLGFLVVIPVISYLKKASSNKKIYYTFTITVLLLGLFSWNVFYHFKTGEMDFGRYFDSLLGKEGIAFIRVTGFILSIYIIISLVIEAYKKKSRLAFFILVTLVPFIIISSFTRPAQRYLLFVYPFVSFYVILILGSRLPRLSKWLGWSTAFVFSVLSFVSTYYLIETGSAEERMAQWASSKGLISETKQDFGVGHAGQYFYRNLRSPKKYLISIREQPPKDYLHKEDVYLFGKKIRSYYIFTLPR
ncbi:MAG TPA: hypothetical protein ENI73_03630, partial [Spirochaetes bacterium]|nr:hypothetical protein [Spirochaetota bacterium]